MEATRAFIVECDTYLATRTSTHEQRLPRYRAVASILRDAGLSDRDTLCDVGAGWTDFDAHLRTGLRWRGRYWPVDGALDGQDLNYWVPPRRAEWFVAIEVLEHLLWPFQLLYRMCAAADKGVVITTPNPAVVDVLALDPTHQSVLPADTLRRGMGMEVREVELFGQERDSLLAWKLT